MPNNSPELLFVTGNQNKVNEAGSYLPGFEVKKAWVEVPEIQSVDVIQVVKAKLKSAFEQTGKSCFVMDASLVIDGLNKKWGEKKFPGALIKDTFGAMGDENICKLVQMNQDTGCLWRAVLWYFDGKQEHYFEESLPGDIASSPRWTNWYDWDTIFVPKWEERTFGEMSSEEKQAFALTKSLYTKFLTFLKSGSDATES